MHCSGRNLKTQYMDLSCIYLSLLRWWGIWGWYRSWCCCLRRSNSFRWYRVIWGGGGCRRSWKRLYGRGHRFCSWRGDRDVWGIMRINLCIYVVRWGILLFNSRCVSWGVSRVFISWYLPCFIWSWDSWRSIFILFRWWVWNWSWCILWVIWRGVVLRGSRRVGSL